MLDTRDPLIVIAEIKEYPERHMHLDLNALTACSTFSYRDGDQVIMAIDTLVFEAHSQFAAIGYNGGLACDVTSGPCSCGAWH